MLLHQRRETSWRRLKPDDTVMPVVSSVAVLRRAMGSPKTFIQLGIGVAGLAKIKINVVGVEQIFAYWRLKRCQKS